MKGENPTVCTRSVFNLTSQRYRLVVKLITVGTTVDEQGHWLVLVDGKTKNKNKNKETYKLVVSWL